MAVVNSVRNILDKLGIDQAVANVLVARSVSVLTGPVTILFIAKFLSKDEQGYYYTFSGIQGLRIFFELGLAFVIMQFASHEKARLDWTPEGTLTGDIQAKERLASLLRISVTWYGIASALAVLLLVGAGMWFFSTSSGGVEHVRWQIPWILVVCTTVGSLALTPLYGILEGCGRIAEVHGINALQTVVSNLALWLVLCVGGRLYASVMPGLAYLAVALPWLFVRYFPLFLDLWIVSRNKRNRISWVREILPLQWKIAASWVSGYFIYQLVTPVLFRYHGAVVAGQFGMTQKIAESIQGVSYSWVATKAATFGSLLAVNSRRELLRIFWKSLGLSVVVAVAISMMFVLGLFSLERWYPAMSNRFLSPWLAIWLSVNLVINCFIFGVATLVRAEKREPFLIPSIVGAIITPLIVFMAGIPFGAAGIAIGVSLANLFLGLPMAVFILSRFLGKSACESPMV